MNAFPVETACYCSFSLSAISLCKWFYCSPSVLSCTVFSVLEVWLQFCSAELSCYIPHICMSSQQQPAHMRCGVSFSLCLCPIASAWVTRQWTWTRGCFGPQRFMAASSPPAVGCLSHTLYLFTVKGCMLFIVYQMCICLVVSSDLGGSCWFIVNWKR